MGEARLTRPILQAKESGEFRSTRTALLYAGIGGHVVTVLNVTFWVDNGWAMGRQCTNPPCTPFITLSG